MFTKLKSRALVASLAFSVAAAAYAADYGALVTNDTSFSGQKVSELVLDQTNAISAWLRVPFNNAGTAYFTMEGLYQFERNYINVSDVDNLPDEQTESIADIDLVKFAAARDVASGSLSFAAGRFATADMSGFVYNQNADGLFLSYESPVIAVSAYGAYTGLLNKRAVTMLSERGSAVEDTEKLYELADKYAVAAATLSFPNIVANQTVTAQFLAAIRLQDEAFNRMYGELSFNGPLVRNTFYSLTSVLGIRNYDGDTDISNLTKANLSLHTGKKALTFGLNGVYASGEQGPFTAFEGFTSQTAVRSSAGRAEYTGLVKGGASVSLKPVNTFLAVLSGEAVFDAQSSSAAYEGFQWQANVNWQIVSDVSVSATFGQYFDNDIAPRDKTICDLYAAISF